MKKYFLGWENIKWLIKELIATFSNQKSYFSRKRIESCLLFVGAFTFTQYFVWSNIDKLTYSEILALEAAQLAYAGYTMSVIQKEKKTDATN